MAEAVKKVQYKQPLLGNSVTNPLYIDGSQSIQVGGTIGNESNGNDYSLLVADMTTRQLLEGILIELKILNLRQQEAFEETVNEEDLCE